MIRITLAVALTVSTAVACAAPFGDKDQAIVMTSSAEAPVPTRKYTIDDHLRLAAIGRATALGDLFVWEQSPPYEEVGYYGLGTNGAWGLAGFQLHAVDAGGAGSGRLLFKPRPGATYKIVSTSPDERYLLYVGVDAGGSFLGVYDRVDDDHRDVDVAPAIGANEELATKWISGDRIAVIASADGAPPLAASRTTAARRRYELEQQAWSGGVSATVSATSGAAAAPVRDRLVVVDAASGRTTALADGAFFYGGRLPYNMAGSHDGRFLAIVGERMTGLAQPIGGATDGGGPRLVVFDLASGAGRIVAADQSVEPGTLAWSPSTSDLAFYAWPAGQSKLDGVYHAANVETGALRTFPHTGLELASQRERGIEQIPEHAFWVGARLAVFTRVYGGAAPHFAERNPFGRELTELAPPHWRLVDEAGGVEPLYDNLEQVSAIPLYADGSSLTVLAGGEAWRLEPGRAPVNLTSDVDGALGHADVEWNLPAGYSSPRLTLPTAGEAGAGYVQLDLASGSVRPAPQAPEGAQLLAGNVAAGRLLLRRDAPDGTDIVTASAGGEVAVVGSINRHMAEVMKTEWRPFDYEATINGKATPLTGCVVYPPDFDPEVVYPVIVEVYVGFSGMACRDPGYAAEYRLGKAADPQFEHLWAAQGYIVLIPGMPAASIRTEDGPIADSAKLAEAGVDALAKVARIDQTRLHLYGHSQGAITALWVASTSDRFDKVVAVNGYVDPYMNYFDTTYQQQFFEDVWPVGMWSQLYAVDANSDLALGAGVTPHTAPMTYVRNSALYRAPEISAPVLLIHSDLDFLPLSGFESMFAALKLAGKDARLVRYWGEGHAPSSPGNMRDMWQEIMDWYGDGAPAE